MRIFLHSLQPGYRQCITDGFTFLGTSGVIRSSDRVVIKPNLTFPYFRQGVMTNPEAVEAMVEYLKNFTDKIVIAESDSGGYNQFSMDEVFAKTGLFEMAKRYGVQVINMTHVPSRNIQFRHKLQKIVVPLPGMLLDETDLFITMPVPKVHCNAGVSIALKNQWGVIQQPELRLKLHPHFKEVVYRINRALPKAIAVVDGKYGLTRSGPLRGDVVELDWILVGDNLFSVDFVVTQLMAYDYRQIPYLKYSFRNEHLDSLANIVFNADYRPFVSTKFYLKREWTDYPGLFTFNSRVLAYLGYESVLAKPLHWLLYRFREPFY